jgi:hypothetical protein
MLLRFLYKKNLAEDDKEGGVDVDAVPLDDLPRLSGKITVFPSAIATYFAPSDQSGIGRLIRERIRSIPSWRKGPARHDCVFVERDPNKAGLRGLHVARVKLFFSVKH